jgi:hypothetical protein
MSQELAELSSVILSVTTFLTDKINFVLFSHTDGYFTLFIIVILVRIEIKVFWRFLAFDTNKLIRIDQSFNLKSSLTLSEKKFVLRLEVDYLYKRVDDTETKNALYNR